MIAQNNVTHMYVCDNIAPVTTAAPTTVRTMGMRKIGERLCSIEAIVAGDGFQVLYMDNAGKLQVSPVLFWDNLVSKNKVAATSDTAQSVAVGYNGTTGSIEVNNSSNYLLTIGYKEGLKQFNKRLYKYGQYTSDAAATQYEIADGIMDSLVPSLNKDAYKMFKVEKLNSGTSIATSGGTLTFTNGSKSVTWIEDGNNNDAGKYNDDHADAAVGDLVRVGHATTKTYPVYKIAAITGAATTTIYLELDQPYQGATATIAAASCGIIPAASEGNYGLLVTALDSNKPFELGKWAFNPIRFDLGLSVDFGATITTVMSSPVRGAGTYKDIAEKEWELLGNRREAFRIAEYPVNYINNSLGANSAETYTLYTLQFKENSTQVIGGTAESFVTLVVAADQTDATLTTQLDTIFVF
jgi:hypothetical protein